VNAEERAEALAAADLVTLTSLAENFGNSGAEAMAAGIPVLVSDQCGVAEGIEEAEVGRVVPVDEEMMVSVLDEMLADRDALRDMGMRGPEFAKALYAADEIARKTACAYRDLIAGTRSPACRWADG
jgi:glycosyltransferase involved in cell wall biosynthesis